MVSPTALALGLTLLLGAVDYASEGILARYATLYKERFVSFVAGLSVTYIFLHLFPQVYSGAQAYPHLIFVLMLLGFVSYHLIEKWIYQHLPREQIIEEVEHEHAITIFFYHFFIGIVFVSLVSASVLNGMLYFIPVSLHVIINVLPHSHRFQHWRARLFFSSAPFLGAAFASIVSIPSIVNFGLLGLLAGLLLFLEAREVIPRKRKGSPAFFLLGVLIYGAVIAWTWTI